MRSEQSGWNHRQPSLQCALAPLQGRNTMGAGHPPLRRSRTHTENLAEIGSPNPAKSAAFSSPNLVYQKQGAAHEFDDTGHPDQRERLQIVESGDVRGGEELSQRVLEV
jgi:hypothetical protein